METTIIRKIKRPNGVGRWPAYVLTEDSFGVWLYSPKGTIYRGRTNSVITECEVGQGNSAAGRAVLHLMPATGWWIASWCGDGDKPVIAVDICTPPIMIRGEWHYVDLELDPHAFGDGRVEILDEDEFQAACGAGLITPFEAIQARTAADGIASQLRSGAEPFGDFGGRLVKDAAALALAPITVLADDTEMADDSDDQGQTLRLKPGHWRG